MSVLLTKDQILDILNKSQTVRGPSLDSRRALLAKRYDSHKLWISVKNFAKSTFDTSLKETFSSKRTVLDSTRP